MSLLFLVFVRWTIKLLSDLVHLFFFSFAAFSITSSTFFFFGWGNVNEGARRYTHICRHTAGNALYFLFPAVWQERKGRTSDALFSFRCCCWNVGLCFLRCRASFRNAGYTDWHPQVIFGLCGLLSLLSFFFFLSCLFSFLLLLPSMILLYFCFPPFFFLERGGGSFCCHCVVRRCGGGFPFFSFADASDGCTRRGKQQWAAAFSISQCRLLFSFFFFLFSFFFGLLIVIKGA